MINEEWTLHDEEHTTAFIAAVRDEEFAALFNGPKYELWSYELPFFEGYYRYRLNNYVMLPFFSMDYVSNGENHFYLDGSDHPIALLLKRGALKLTADNVLSYLDFFDDVVFDPDQKVKFIVEAHDTAYSGAGAMAHHFKAIRFTDQRRIEERGDHFLLTLPLLYNGQTVQGRIRVMKDGHIHIEEPVQISLIETVLDSLNPLAYRHPHEAQILEKNLSVLALSPQGLELKQSIEESGANVRVLAGLGADALAPAPSKGIIVAPHKIKDYSPYQLIALIGVLRDLEFQNAHGSRGSVGAGAAQEINAFALNNCVVNLDIWLKICIILDELEERGVHAVETLRKIGLGPIYSGYKNQIDEKDMISRACAYMRIPVQED